MARYFFSLNLLESLSPPQRSELELMESGIRGARWEPPEKWHLTLAFLGDVSGTKENELFYLAEEMKVPEFELVLSGVGQFPLRGQPTVLWLGVKNNPALTALAEGLQKDLTQAGFHLEKRKFHPHLTLARLKNPRFGDTEAWIQNHISYQSSPLHIKQFYLMSSTLSAQGSKYTVEDCFCLGSY